MSKLTYFELIERMMRAREAVNALHDALCSLEGPRFDEDYKLEGYPGLTAELLTRIENQANELAGKLNEVL